MRLLWIVLLLAGCAADQDSQPSTFNAHVNGRYTTFGGIGLNR